MAVCFLFLTFIIPTDAYKATNMNLNNLEEIFKLFKIIYKE